MEAKEKADQLIQSYRTHINFDSNLELKWYSPQDKVRHLKVNKESILFALVAVEYLIEEQEMWQNGEAEPVLFWQKVKKELKLKL